VVARTKPGDPDPPISFDLAIKIFCHAVVA
jgi:hypothetical protein